MKGVFFVAALTSILAVLLICLFLFANGIPAMGKIGVFDFLLGQKWAPTDSPASYGIFPMILGSIYVTAGAIIIGVPIGILTAVFMARFCPKGLYKILKPAVDLLAGIPICRIRIFRRHGAGSFCAGQLWRDRSEHPDGVYPAGNYDSADYYRGERIGHPRRAGKLL